MLASLTPNDKSKSKVRTSYLELQGEGKLMLTNLPPNDKSRSKLRTLYLELQAEGKLMLTSFTPSDKSKSKVRITKTIYHDLLSSPRTHRESPFRRHPNCKRLHSTWVL